MSTMMSTRAATAVTLAMRMPEMVEMLLLLVVDDHAADGDGDHDGRNHGVSNSDCTEWRGGKITISPTLLMERGAIGGLPPQIPSPFYTLLTPWPFTFHHRLQVGHRQHRAVHQGGL